MKQASTTLPNDAHAQHPDEHPDISALNARTGLWLFLSYLAAYSLFIRLAAASPETLGIVTPLGPNVAIIYGFGLIFGAVVVALVYMRLCKRNAERFGNDGGSP